MSRNHMLSRCRRCGYVPGATLDMTTLDEEDTKTLANAGYSVGVNMHGWPMASKVGVTYGLHPARAELHRVQCDPELKSSCLKRTPPYAD